MADLNWKWVLIFAVIAILLYRASPLPVTIPAQATLNVEQDKQAAIAFQIQVAPKDSDLSDNNYTLQFGNYKIVSKNGTTITTSGTTDVNGVYNVVVDYAPKVNSTVIAEVTEKLYNINATCTCTPPENGTCVQVCTNTSTFISQKSLAIQSVDVNVILAQGAAVVVVTSSGNSYPLTANTPVTPTSNLTPPTLDILVPAQ